MTDELPPGYPTRWEADVVAADGGTVRLRPIRPDDQDRHRAFVARLSPEAKYYRFFSPRDTLTDKEVRHFCTVDYVDRMAFVALLDGDIIAIARYDGVHDDERREAEVAFVIADEHQGRGLGTILLEFLAEAAREHGFRRFTAQTLPDNRRMLRVFHDAGYRVVEGFDSGVIEVAFDIEATDEARARIERREHDAERHSIERILAPRSVAVVGASDRPGTIGHHLLTNLLRGGFDGSVYPVNPARSHVASVPCYPSVGAIPDEVDLAVVAVPREHCVEVVDECAAKQVKGLVVISAGFSEVGDEGAELEHQLLVAARRGGMRMVGPNCLGVVNTAVGLDATFAPQPPLPGRVAFLSQSGALGIALLEWTARLGLGISSFVSIGNKADVSGNDLLQYWEDDEGTDLVLMYLESFGNPRKFSRVARRISQRKPIVAVKSGRTVAGSRAASSHTAAAASADVAVSALFRQTGVIRVDTLDELFDLAQVLATQPLPAGKRVAIVSNSGGPGILAADACESAGLEVVRLGERTRAAVRARLGPNAAVGNPIDMVASASPEQYEEVLRLVLDDDDVDNVIVIFTPPLVTQADDVAVAIARAVEGATKPIIANFLASREVPLPLAGGDGRRRVPSFPSPEPAAIALGRVVRYAEWRRRDPGTVPVFDDIEMATARAIVDAALVRHPDGCWLDADVAVGLLAAYGVAVAPVRRAADADEAVAHAEAFGYPVALKAAAGGLVHKSDVGGLRLGLRDAQSVRDAFIAMEAVVGDEQLGGIVVQPMARSGVETIIGVVQDLAFGPLVMFGMGGVATELLADRTFRVLPLTDVDAAEVVRSLRGSPLLFGYRGSPPADTAALEAMLGRVGQLADDIPELAELDLNPVVVSERGAVAVDVKVRVAPVPPIRPSVRALREG
ncbi:MAG: GNAT family N-acetyltransferase [Acidimicrobiales bacterium]